MSELHIRTTHCVVVGVPVSQYARRERGNRKGVREGGRERASEREGARVGMCAHAAGAACYSAESAVAAAASVEVLPGVGVGLSLAVVQMFQVL